MIIYEIAGTPIPLKRPRFFKNRCYDSQKVEKRIFANKLKNIMQEDQPYSEAIQLTIEYHMPIPESMSGKRKKELIGTAHFKRPDLSNLIKFTEDALNGVLWEDDSIIGKIIASKFYSKDAKTVFKVDALSQRIFCQKKE